MGILRKTVQREVIDSLNSTIFTSDDFNIVFGDPEQNQYIIQIKFMHDTSYEYGIYKQKSGSMPLFYAKRRPGDIEEEQTSQYQNLQGALNGIEAWCVEIRNELKASTPIYKEVDELKKVIFDHINVNHESPDFSVEEINSLRQKFADLEQRIVELEKDKVITDKQLKEFQDGISRVADDLEFYPKETWVKTAANKLVKLVIDIGKSKEGRAVLANGAIKMLGLE